MTNQKTINAINAILPQTQCGLCTYKGCKPYAEAIIEKNERVDLCLPGGLGVLKKIGDLCDIDTKPLETNMLKKTKPAMLAVIREDECIGCTKCIQACPVDAIVGASKFMHTIITDMCNGCELCVAPCPVDCIDMIVLSEKTEDEKIKLADQSRERFEAHNIRLEKERIRDREKYLQSKQAGLKNKTVGERKIEIAEILKRTRKT
ncbi:MAG: RnfABCDGE type electron transport complex subunit B [Gammaproteobacteria bacterium]|nr:RnfABCDGE type electron transport complex subunit B [Gammaproteobacteria bacterium]